MFVSVLSIVQGSKRFPMQKLKTVNQKLEIQVPFVILPNNNILLLKENSVETELNLYKYSRLKNLHDFES